MKFGEDFGQLPKNERAQIVAKRRKLVARGVASLVVAAGIFAGIKAETGSPNPANEKITATFGDFGTDWAAANGILKAENSNADPRPIVAELQAAQRIQNPNVPAGETEVGETTTINGYAANPNTETFDYENVHIQSHPLDRQ